MKRNGGYIKPDKVVVKKSSGTSGVFDTFDAYGYRKELEWPTQPQINSISFSGNNNPLNGKLLWGSAITITFIGVNLTGQTLFVEYSSSNNVVNGALGDQFATVQSDLQASVEITLPLQNYSIAATQVVITVRKGNSQGGILISQTFDISAYTVEIGTGSPRNEGDTVYSNLYITGVGATVGNSLDVQFLNNWGTSDFYTDSTPVDYSGSYNSSFGVVQYTGNMGQLREDMVTEGTETFTIQYRSYGGTSGLGYNYFYGFANTGVGYNQFEVNDTSYYVSTTANVNNIDEGSSINILLSAKDVGTRAFSWKIVDTSNNLFDEDQWQTPVEGSANWSGLVNPSTGNFEYTIQAIPAVDFLTEGAQTFRIQVFNDVGALINTSSNFTINDSSYLVSVSQTATSINEGSSVTYTINTYGGVPNVSYTYYWKTDQVSVGTGFFQDTDFTDTALAGTFTIAQTTWPNFSGTITRTAAADGFTEGAESFQLKIGPSANNLSNAGNAVTISDTSTGTAEPASGLYAQALQQDYNTSFVEILNRAIDSDAYMGNNADYNGPYDVCDIAIDGTATGSRRIYLGLCVTHSVYTFWNDIAIAAVQHLNAAGNTIKNSWVFHSSSGGSGSGWQTTTQALSGNSSNSMTRTPSTVSGLSFSSIGSGGNTNYWTWASSTGSAPTGAADGINSSYVTSIIPAPNGSVTNPGAASAQNALVSQTGGTYYAFVECSGIGLYQERYMRSPSVTVAQGDVFRVVHCMATDNPSNININNTLYFGIA